MSDFSTVSGNVIKFCVLIILSSELLVIFTMFNPQQVYVFITQICSGSFKVNFDFDLVVFRKPTQINAPIKCLSAEFTYFNFVKRLNTNAELPLIFILIKLHEAQITFS